MNHIRLDQGGMRSTGKLCDKENDSLQRTNVGKETSKPSATRLRRPTNRVSASLSSSGDEKSGQNAYRESLEHFQRCQRYLSSVENFWRERPELPVAIVRASISATDDQLTDVMYMEEQCHSILSMCRKLIKEASDMNIDQKSLEAALGIVIHSLRAIGRIVVSDVPRHELAIKLLFHSVSLCAVGGRSKRRLSAPLLIAAIAGFDALGNALARYSIRHTDNTHICFRRRSARCEGGSLSMFPVPVFRNGGASTGTFSLRQIATTAVKSTLTILDLMNQCIMSKFSSKASMIEFGPKCRDILLGEFFGCWNQSSTPLNSTIELVDSVGTKWASFLVESRSKDCIADAVSYFGAFYRNIWEVSACSMLMVDGERGLSFERKRIKLRQHAISVIVNDSFLHHPKLASFLHGRVLADACSSTRRAASQYAQGVGGDSSNTKYLTEFYNDLGSRFCMIVSSIPLSDIPHCYLEFCAYRFTFTGINRGVHKCEKASCCMEFLDPCQGSSLKHGGNGVVVALALFRLIAFIKRKLGKPGKVDDQAHFACDHSISFSTYAEDIMEAFRSQFLNPSHLVSEEIRASTYKCLSMLNIQLALYDYLKTFPEHFEIENITIAARFLSSCLGPFEFSMFHRTNEPDRKSACLNSAIECYVQSVSAFDALHVKIPDQGFSTNSDEILHELVRNVAFDGSFLASFASQIERLVKSLASISRRRSQKSMDRESIYPLLMAMKICYKVELTGNHATFSPPICDRWLQLGLLYRSIDMIEEMMLAMMASLAFSNMQASEYSNESPDAYDLVSFFSSCSQGVLVTTADRFSINPQHGQIIRSVVTAYISMGHLGNAGGSNVSQKSFGGLSLLRMLSSVNESAKLHDSCLDDSMSCKAAFRKASGTSFCLSALVEVLFSWNRSDKKVLWCWTLFLMELQRSLASSICCLMRNDEDDIGSAVKNLVIEYERNAATIVQLVKQLSNAEEKSLRAIIIATYYLASSTTLIPLQTRKLLKESKGLVAANSLAERLAKKSLAWIDSVTDDKASPLSSKSCAICLRIPIVQFYATFTDRSALGDDPRSVKRLVQQLNEAREHVAYSDSQIHRLSRESMMQDLMKRYYNCSRRADNLEAAIIGIWLSQYHESPEYIHLSLNRAAAISSCINLDMPQWANHLSNNELSASAVHQDVEDPFRRLISLEEKVCITRMKYRFACDDSLLRSYREMVSVGRRFEEDMASGDEETHALSMWVLSTLELACSEIAASRGFEAIAVAHVQSCRQACRDLVDILSNNDPSRAQSDGISGRVFRHISSSVDFRIMDCLRRMSHLYTLLGQDRKSVRYAAQALSYYNGQDLEFGNTGEAGIEEAVSILNGCEWSVDQRNAYDLLKTQSVSSTQDTVLMVFERSGMLGENSHSITPKWNVIQGLIGLGDVLYGDSLGILANSSNSFYQQSERLFSSFLSASKLSSASLSLSPNYHMEICRVRDLLRDDGAPDRFNNERQAREVCEQLIRTPTVPSDTKMWAYFYLGNMELEEARESGALHHLWRGFCNIDAVRYDDRICEDSVAKARKYFSAAFCLLGSATPVLRRKILRSLALATGPDTNSRPSAMCASTLILSSISQPISIKISALENNTLGRDSEELFAVMCGCYSDPKLRESAAASFYSQFRRFVPGDWQFCAMALCDSKEILVTSMRVDETTREVSVRSVCVFPVNETSNTYVSILSPFDRMIEVSDAHLKGSDATASDKLSTKEVDKHAWWDSRKEFDEGLDQLTRRVEEQYFQSSCVKEAILGPNIGAFESEVQGEKRPADPSCNNLASMFEAACSLSDKAPVEEDIIEKSRCFVDVEAEKKALNKLTVVKLKEKLVEEGIPPARFRKVRKAGLIDMLIEIQSQDSDEGSSVESNVEVPLDADNRSIRKSVPANRRTHFLVLDENLHRFPFEGIPMLRGRAVTRIPSISFVLATMQRRQSNEILAVDPRKSSYVVDPENNLNQTKDRMMDIIQEIQSKNGYKWNGVAGQIPPETFFKQALTRQNGVLLYCGHGGGQMCFSRRNIERMSPRNDSDSCNATVVLMGCSSGRLASINRKGTKSLEELPLYYSPEGMALSYLKAGAPCVVGALWDVTDRDIDRYSAKLFESFLGDGQEEGLTLAECVSRARDVCKMKFAVGLAPVCYGVPVHTSSRPQ